MFQKDARGRVSVLFPNPDYNTGANPLPPVDAYTLPAAGRWYQLDEAVGLETLYVVCAARRLEICERLQRLAQAEAVKSEVGEMLRDVQRTSVAPGPESKGHTVFVQQFDHRGRVNE